MPGEKPKAAEIKSFMRAHGIADFKVPDQVVFVAEFETTAVGKVSRKRLRETMRAQFLNQKANRKP